MRIYNTEPITLGINDLASLKKHHQLPLHLTVTGTGPQPSPQTRGSRTRTPSSPRGYFSFFFNDTATTEIYTLSLHDALPISPFRQVPARAPYAKARAFHEIGRAHV